MVDYTMSEEVILPSEGKIYNGNVSSVVKLKSMTTRHEMLRLSPNERPYKNICDIIDDCIVDDIGISSYDMCMQDYQYLLYKLRTVTYGSDYNCDTVCKYCLSDTHHTIKLDDLEVVPYDEDLIAKYIELDLPVTKKHVKLKMQTPRMLDDITLKKKELLKKAKDYKGDPAFLFSLVDSIETIDGEKLDPIKRESFIENLPMADTNRILFNITKLAESFGVSPTFEFTCPVCGLDYTTSFRITSEFFGPTYDA